MRRIKQDNVTGVVASSTLTNFPASFLMDEHPSRIWKGGVGERSVTLSMSVAFGMTDIMLFNTNAETAAISIYDPNFMEWGFATDGWGGLESGAMTTAIDKIVASSANVVDVFIYDTTRDSDGGAWVDGEIAQATSWYLETLNTATRGATRPFPALTLIVAETTKVTIYDATQATVPMWMTIPRDASGGVNATMWWRNVIPGAAVSAKNGVLSIGLTNATTSDNASILTVSFIADNLARISNSAPHSNSGATVSQRGTIIALSNNTGLTIVASLVNDVAMTVLPDAPTDSTTGLPMPTIAVATAGGVSVIDGPAGVGTVVDIVFAGTSFVAFNDASDRLFIGFSGAGALCFGSIPAIDYATIAAWRDGYYNNSSVPALIGTDSPRVSEKAVGGVSGLTLLKEDTTTPANGMVNHLTTDYQTGWMQGDIKLATLADSTAETVGVDITTEHVSNGTFATNDLTGWTDDSVGSGTVVASSGAAVITSTDGSNYGKISQDLTLVSGEIYEIVFTVSVTNGAYVSIPGFTGVSGNYTPGSTRTLTAKAISTSGGISFQVVGNAGTTTIDNISVKRIQNVVENGEMSSDRVWTLNTGWTISGGIATCDGSQSGASNVGQNVLTIGKTYLVTYELLSRTAGSIKVVLGTTYSDSHTVPAVYSVVLTAATTGWMLLQADTSFAGTIDNVTVYELDTPDRSVNDNHLQVVGELTKTAVASGSELVAWSGFSADDYIEQPYNSDLDFGTGDFYVMGWLNTTQGGNDVLLQRSDTGFAGNYFTVFSYTGGLIRFSVLSDNLNSTVTVNDGEWHLVVARRVSGVSSINIDGTNDTSVAAAGDVDNALAITTLGIRVDGAVPFDGSLALWRIGAGAPSAAQIAEIYAQEKKLFVANADCTLAGTSDSVVALAYDEPTEKLHVLTNGYRSVFQGLRRVDSAVVTGTEVAVDALRDRVATAITTAVQMDVPAFNLREELEDKDRQIASLSMPLVPYVSAGAAQTQVQLPLGYEPQMVFDDGALIQPTSITTDGYYKYVNVSSSTGDITVMCRVVPR